MTRAWRPPSGRPRGAGRQWTEARLDRAQQMLLAGHATEEIAAALGVTRKAFLNAVSVYGLSRSDDPDAAGRVRANARALARLAAHHRPGTGEMAIAGRPASPPRRALPVPEVPGGDMTALLMGDPPAVLRRAPSRAERLESARAAWPGGRGPVVSREPS